MTRVLDMLQEHWAAIILALFASLLVAAPQLYFRFEHRQDGVYQGIELLPDSPWSTRVREVMDGHPNLGSIYYQDGKSDPYLFQPLGSMTVAYMGKPFGLDINNTLLLSRAVLPFFAVLLLYAFVFLFSRDKRAALAAAAVLLLADPVLNFSGIKALLGGSSPGSFIDLTRPVNSAMLYIPLFGFLSAFWLFFRKGDWRWGALSAILLGLNFYNYFYSWTALYAFGGLLGLLLLAQKKWRQAAGVAAVYLGGLLVAIPYGINLYRATEHPAYAEVSLRFGVVATHAPMFIGLLAAAALIAFLLFFPKENKSRYFFGLALLLVPFVTLNQQLITGKVLQAAHYHWYFHRPLAVILVLILLFHLLGRFGSELYKKALLAVIIAVTVYTAVFTQISSYLYDGRDGGSIAVERQKYGPVMQWLNQNAANEEVVLANEEASHITVIYTPQNDYYHRSAIYSLSATTERLLEQLFTYYRLRGVGAQDAREVFFAERGYLSASIYGMHYREAAGSYEAIPDEKIEEMLARYQTTLSTPTSAWLEEQMVKYQVSYAVWDKKKDPLWELQKYPFLQEAATFGDFVIYRFIP